MRPDLMPAKRLTMTPIGPARIEGCPSTQYHLNELVITPAGPARMVGAFHDKQNGRTQAIVALEGQPFEGFTNSARLAYVDWDKIKRLGSNLTSVGAALNHVGPNFEFPKTAKE